MNLFKSIGQIITAFTQVFVSSANGVNEYAKAFEGTGRMANNAVKTMVLEQEEEILNRFEFEFNFSDWDIVAAIFENCTKTTKKQVKTTNKKGTHKITQNAPKLCKVVKKTLR